MTSKIPTVSIHGKDYVTVATRVNLFHDDNTEGEIVTECISHNPVVFKAVVKTKKGIFTGFSSVSLDSAKMIERSNPYEVAETSAVGRALGFAGYGSTDSIASADEMAKATPDASPAYSTYNQNTHVTAQNSLQGDYTAPDTEIPVPSTPPPVKSDTEPDSPYAKWSPGKLKVEVSALMNSGKLKKDFAGIQKMTREEAITLLLSAQKGVK